MPRRTAFVGRSRSSDIHLTDRTVSRLHAELTLADDGGIYVTDCGSRYGTQVRTRSGWMPVRQRFVRTNDVLRLGDFEIAVGELLARVPWTSGEDAAQTQASGRPAGPVERNPSTGEVRPKT